MKPRRKNRSCHCFAVRFTSGDQDALCRHCQQRADYLARRAKAKAEKRTWEQDRQALLIADIKARRAAGIRPALVTAQLGDSQLLAAK